MTSTLTPTLTPIPTLTSTSTVTGTVIDDTEIDRLAWDVERAGLGGHEAVIDRVVERARPAGVNPVLVDVLADPGAPECARVRALGRVAMYLGSHRLAA